MDQFENWCRNITLFSIVSSVFSFILPEDGNKKIFNVFLSFIMIFIAFGSFRNNEDSVFDFDVIFTKNNSLNIEEKADEYKKGALLEVSESEIEKHIKDSLFKSGIVCECSVSCFYDKDIIKVKYISIEGSITEKDKKVLNEIISEITDNETDIILNGERYD